MHTLWNLNSFIAWMYVNNHQFLLPLLLDPDFDSNVYNFIPFYCMYTAFIPLHGKFAVTIFRIGQRYRCLNSIILNYAAAGQFIIVHKLASICFAITIGISLSFTVNKYGYFRTDYQQADDVIHRFMRIYDSLGTVLECESQ